MHVSGSSLNTRKENCHASRYLCRASGSGAKNKRGYGTAKEQKTCVHRSGKSQRQDFVFNILVRFETIDAASGKEV